MVSCEVCGAELQDDVQVVGLFCPNKCDQERDRENQISFYSRKEEYGWLSNFQRAEITIEGKLYPTVEHFYQSMKANNPETEAWIASAPSSYLAMKSGRSLREDLDLVSFWDDYKVGHMLKGLRAKFIQNEHLKEKLLETGDKILFEDSPTDMFWGGRLAGSKDMLGLLIMQVREEIRTTTLPHTMTGPPDQIIVRKVRVLGERVRKLADNMSLDENDLVLVETFITPFPVYRLTKIEGSPVDFIQKKFFGEEVDK